MRDMSGGGFTGAVRHIFHRHKFHIKLADQDILNAIFGYSPWYLYEFPCSWNYIIWQCRVDFWSKYPNPRTWLGRNQCKEAEVHGISLLHGNAVSFFILFEEVFREIYRYWANFDVEKGDLSSAGSLMRAK